VGRLRWWLIAWVWAVAGAAVAADKPAPPPCAKATFEGDAFTLCRYDPRADELRLVWSGKHGPVGSLPALAAGLGKDASRVLFAMNAGMYHPDLSPVGLFVEAWDVRSPLNQASGKGNFFLAPNGVFWVDPTGAAHLDETAAYAARNPQPMWATQSGPLLVRSGALHPAISPNGASLAVRNAVGVQAGGGVWFVISDRPVSLGRLARFLRDELKCPDVLYLDGAVSSLWAPALKRMDRRTGLGTFVLVLRR
jgi:uncharacterized protein YigE (DUF2233 family)